LIGDNIFVTGQGTSSKCSPPKFHPTRVLVGCLHWICRHDTPWR